MASAGNQDGNKRRRTRDMEAETLTGDKWQRRHQLPMAEEEKKVAEFAMSMLAARDLIDTSKIR